MNLSSSFTLLGKLSSTEQSEPPAFQKEFEPLFSVVNHQLLPLLDSSDYAGKSRLKADMDAEIENCRLLLRYPSLAMRTSLGIFPGKSQEGLAFMKRLTRSTVRPLYARIRNLPCILYDSPEAMEIHVTNNAGNVILLSEGEMEEMLSLYKQGVKVEDILQSCAISGQTVHRHINYVFFPAFARRGAPDYKRLIRLCSAYFVFYSDLAESRALHDSVIQSKGMVFIVYRNGQKEGCHELVHSMSEYYPALQFTALPLEDMEKVLHRYDQLASSCAFCEAFLLNILKLAVSQKHSIEQHSMSAKALAEDSFQQEAGDVVKQTLQTLQKAELSAADNAKYIGTELSKIRENLMQAALNFRNALLCSREEIVPGTLNPALMQGKYGDICGEIVLLTLELNEQSTALQYIIALENAKHPHSYLYRLYYNKVKGELLPNDLLKKLAQEGTDTDTVIRGKINFASELQLSDSARNDLAYKLKGECTSQETFFKACKIEQAQGIGSAVAIYQNAFQKGSIAAGKRLAEFYNQAGDYKSLKRCADRLIPEAALLYAKSCTQSNQRNKKVTYLHIAVAQRYDPAIQYYANMLYDDLVGMNLAGKKPPARQLRIAIGLFKYMVERNVYGSKNRFGVLLYLDGNYQAAKPYLDSGKDGKYYLGRMYAKGQGVAVDRDRAIRYLQESNTPQARKLSRELMAEKEEEAAERGQSTSYSSGSSYQSTSSNYSSSSDCFITTATCQAEGKADDCEELTAFRRYRDEVLLHSETGKALVGEYYRIAPDIVELIQNDPKCEQIYQYLYTHYILPGYNLLSNGKGDEAKKLYCTAVLALAKRYGIKVSLEKSMANWDCVLSDV